MALLPISRLHCQRSRRILDAAIAKVHDIELGRNHESSRREASISSLWKSRSNARFALGTVGCQMIHQLADSPLEYDYAANIDDGRGTVFGLRSSNLWNGWPGLNRHLQLGS